ncbi:molecular chaperone DnaJ [Bacteroidia bacterium]|nr:molecular chaperone DnaJ [Bacteroidia bacterium]
MIKKCDHTGCDKAGTCRAPKSRDLREYWQFCPAHAAEYNKNWNYYADMTRDDIERDWERQVFGTELKDKKKAKVESAEYLNFLNNFLHGRAEFDKIPSKKSLPSATLSAFKTLDLPVTAGFAEVRKQYRALAKKFHPDTTKHADKKTAEIAFASISAAYSVLEKHFKPCP